MVTQSTIKTAVARHERLSRQHRDAVRKLQGQCSHPDGTWTAVPFGSAMCGKENYWCPDCHYASQRDIVKMEYCCDCGAEYPRTELLDGHIYCSTCRVLLCNLPRVR